VGLAFELPIALGSDLASEAYRAATSNRLSPSNIGPMARPPNASSMTFWISLILVPYRAASCRRMRIRSCGWSASCSIELSAAPRICCTSRNISVARRRSSPRSGPLMMIARSAEEPVAIHNPVVADFQAAKIGVR